MSAIELLPPSVRVEDVVALIEAERERYWHTTPPLRAGGGRVRDVEASMRCSNCSVAHRLLDDLLFKLRPTEERARTMTTSTTSRPCCDVCTP